MQAKALIDAYDFSALELGLIKTQHLPPGRKGASTFPRKAVRQPAPPKYQDPKTGATWSGRGRQPLWMTDERDEYLLKA
jgi:DNA-binding protein H-NS